MPSFWVMQQQMISKWNLIAPLNLINCEWEKVAACLSQKISLFFKYRAAQQ
jgi:hypothetical protein